MITGIDRPTYGEVIVGGQPIHKLSEHEMASGAAVMSASSSNSSNSCQP
jgi:ABC-type cobalamin/Fe3+-siderophores transport system ATPase subunit